MSLKLRVTRSILVLTVIGALLTGVGCGDVGEAGTQSATQQQAHRQAAKRRAVRRHQARIRVRHAAARARAQRAHRAQVRLVHSEEAAAARAEGQEVAAEEESAESECDPNYSGACLDPYSSDYDCEGGSGNGPDYTGTVTVVGEDHYELDADGDGIGCEPY